MFSAIDAKLHTVALNKNLKVKFQLFLELKYFILSNILYGDNYK